MPYLPKISGQVAMKIFEKLGWDKIRQKGSHCRMKKENLKIVIPNHKELDTGTLKAIIRQSGLTNEEFIKFYNKF